ncbi:hypothetical protein LCGC14_0728230 [marine sediment metagenome]|uniref:Uncharacterized protein n=1 Tax=marine sediment metagenome TaxID=412755 RepID=A0A0F9THJ9_9ZZZZ
MIIPCPNCGMPWEVDFDRLRPGELACPKCEESAKRKAKGSDLPDCDSCAKERFNLPKEDNYGAGE